MRGELLSEIVVDVPAEVPNNAGTRLLNDVDARFLNEANNSVMYIGYLIQELVFALVWFPILYTYKSSLQTDASIIWNYLFAITWIRMFIVGWCVTFYILEKTVNRFMLYTWILVTALIAKAILAFNAKYKYNNEVDFTHDNYTHLYGILIADVAYGYITFGAAGLSCIAAGLSCIVSACAATNTRE